MRVLLCQSYLGPMKTAPPIVFPRGLSYLAAMINNEHEVHCWDPNVSEDYKKELSKLLERTLPDIVGLSLRNIDTASSIHNHSFYPLFRSMIKIIKEIVPSCILVVGGCGFSLFAEEIIKRNPEIDFGIISEGEYPFANLLKNLGHPERVNNLIFRKGGQIQKTEKRFYDFDSLPQPAIEAFDLRPYQKHRYSMSIQSKRGCGFNCIFCPTKFLFGNKIIDVIKYSLFNTACICFNESFTGNIFK